MAQPTLVAILLVVHCLAILSTLDFITYVQAADEDPLQDFCVADVNNMQVTLNGFICKPAGQVQSSDFASPLLREPRNLNQALGVAVNLASAANFPALNTQGLSIARIDFQPKGLNPPHVHPRATEVLFLAKGALVVGFVSTTGNTLFQQTLQEGDLFVFPRGLPHFQLNPDIRKPALAISALNSQNPGVSQLAAALFAAQPPLPHEVLQIALGIDDQHEIDRIIAGVATTV
ncbi:hypothetical protein L7F22_007397 [Adiantum nelumboides]|nr:hypothetical protein [Adiantum nelumboides]